MSIPKNLRTLKTNFEKADGLGISKIYFKLINHTLNKTINVSFIVKYVGNRRKAVFLIFAKPETHLSNSSEVCNA